MPGVHPGSPWGCRDPWERGRPVTTLSAWQPGGFWEAWDELTAQKSALHTGCFQAGRQAASTVPQMRFSRGRRPQPTRHHGAPPVTGIGQKRERERWGSEGGRGERDFLQEAFGSHPAKAKKSHLCPLVCAEATSPGRRSLHPGPGRCRRGWQSRPQTALERETQQEAESFFFFVPVFGPAQLQCQEALRRQPQGAHQAPGREPDRREPSFLGSRASLPGLL